MAKDLPARVRLGVLDGLSKTLDSVRDKFPQISRAVGRTNTAFNIIEASTAKYRKTLKKIGTGITDVGKTMTVGFTLPVLAASGFAVHRFMEIEDALAEIKGSANLSGDEVQAFSQKIGDATKYIATPKTELLKLAGVAGDIGVRGVDNLTKFTVAMTQISKITGISATEAADDVFKLLNMTGEGVGAIDKFGSALAATGDKYGVSAKKIIDSTFAIGREISKFKVSSAQVIGLAAAVEPLGFNAKQSSGAVGDAFRSIDTAIREGGVKLKGLEAITGMSGAALKKQFGDDATVVFRKFLDGLDKVKQKGGPTEKVLAFFGASGEKTQIILEGLAKDTGKLGEIMAFSGEEFAKNTALTEKYDEAVATFSGKLQLLQNKVGLLAEKLGAFLVPYLSKFADILGKVADFLNNNPGFASFLAVLAGIVAVIGPILVGIGFFVSSLASLITAVGIISAALAGFGGILGFVNGMLLPWVIIPALVVAALVGLYVLLVKFGPAIKEGFGAAWDWAAGKVQWFIDKVDGAISALREFMGLSNQKIAAPKGGALNGAPGLVPQGVPMGGVEAQASVNPEFSQQTNNARVDINVRAPQSTSISSESQGGFLSINRGLAGAF